MPQHDPIPRRPRVPPTVAEPAAPRDHGIDNPHAWARYRRIMRWMTALAVACVLVTLAIFHWLGGPLTLPMGIATSIGVFLTVIVGTGLMSLVFLSAGSGHDADAADPFDQRGR